MPPVVSMVGPKTPKDGKDSIACNEVNQNIQVFVRCRPLKASEKKSVVDVVTDRKEVRINERGVSLPDRYTTKTFTFDNTFCVETKQIDVYLSVVAPLIEQVLAGYNCTVFAYGQTGTGKTYTMEGERSSEDKLCSWESDPECGIIPRAMHQLFEELQNQTNEHTVRVSFLELYNEELYDLLSAIDDTTKLKIYEDSIRKGSTIVGGLEEVTVNTKSEIYDILRKGSSKRQTACTLLNACSSRSHTIFSVTVHIKENCIDGEDMVKIGKLNLVDLAGSENIGRSGAIDKRAREAGNINQSLLTLGRVITCLVEKAPHIPYRESKLTRLLQDSLGGRTKTSIIATISPNILDVEDTLSTLEYAQRAKKITNKPEVNQKMSKKTLLREYTAEIERLRRDLLACRERNGIYINEDNYNAMQEQIKIQNEEIENRNAQIQALKEEMAKITVLFDNTKETLDMRTNELEITNNTLRVTNNTLHETNYVLHITQTDRDEQKYLVDKHVDSEKLLFSQADQLLTVVSQTTGDVMKLHQKVDRQKSIENMNLSKIEEFQIKFRNDMKRMEELVFITTSAYNDNLNKLQTIIMKKCNDINGVVSNVHQNIALFSKSLTEHNHNITSLHNKDRIVLEQTIELRDKNNDIISTNVSNLEEFVVKLNKSQSLLEEDIQSIVNTVAQQRLSTEELIMKQNTYLKNIKDVIENVFHDIKTDISISYDAYSNDIMCYKSEIERIKNERIHSKQSMGKQWNELEKLINSIKVEQNKDDMNFQSFSSDMSDKLNEAQNTYKSSKQNMIEKIDNISDRIYLEEKAGFDCIEELDKLNTIETQEVINKCNGIVSAFRDKTNETLATINAAKKDFSEKTNESVNLNENIIKFSDLQMNDKRNAVSNMFEIFNSELMSQNMLADHINQNTGNINEQTAQKVDEMVLISSTMEKSQIREITNRYNEFEKFSKNDVMTYTPTGVTPQKTNYNYPRNLTQTSPHEKILERYRAELDTNVAVNTPLPEESDSELLSDSCNSATSNNSNNNENMPIKIKQKHVSKINSKSEIRKMNESDSIDLFEKSEACKVKSKCKKSRSKTNLKAVPLKTTHLNN